MKKRILIIDDDEDLLAALKERLHIHGFRCVTATCAMKGFKKARSTKPDLILLDLGLGDMSGYGFLRKLKTEQTISQIPVVILSGQNDEEVVREGIELGAVGYLNKKCGARALVATVQDYSSKNNLKEMTAVH